MIRNIKFATVITTSALLLFTLVGSVQAAPNSKSKSNSHRFAGQDRFQTSISIAQQEFQGQQVSNVVLASAYSFPDALAASTLATKLKAPIILVGTSLKDSKVSLDFIKNHMTPGGTVTIVGGVAVVPKKVEEWLLNAGYAVTRLGGKDRFATDALIVKNLSVTTGTAIVIASGYDFPDALGVASIAASKGWPILLSGPNGLPESVKNFIFTDQPTNIYIVGGKFILHDSIQSELQSAAPNAQIQRFGGQDRFDTLSQILYKFYPNPTQIYLANGFDFADALSGSTLAAQNNGPILLINPKSGNLPPAIRDYLITLRTTGVTPQVNVLGGSVGVPDWVVDRVNEILGSSVTPPAVPPLTVSNPTTSAFTVTLNPAVNGLTVSNFTLLNSMGNPVAITSATTSNNGGTYTISAALSAGQTYTVTATSTGNTFGTAQNVTVPSAAIGETLTVSNPSNSGFTVALSPALVGLTSSDFTLLDGSTPVAISSASTADNGTTYTIAATLTVGKTYSITATKTSYTFGLAQNIVVPQ